MCGLKRRVWLLWCLILIANVSFVNVAAQDLQQRDDCPADWSDYINIAASLTERRAENDGYFMFFADEEGIMYNCLGEGISEADERYLGLTLKMFARIWAEEAVREGRFPENLCSITYTGDIGFLNNAGFGGRSGYLTLHLPRQEKTMELPDCKKRLSELTKQMKLMIAAHL